MTGVAWGGPGPQGQPEGARAYVDDLATKRFVNLNRLLRKRNRQGVAPTAEEVAEGSVEGVEGVDTEANPALDLRILLDDVMRDSKPLDFQAVIDSQPPLKVSAGLVSTPFERMLTAVRPHHTCTRAHYLRPSVGLPHASGGGLQPGHTTTSDAERLHVRGGPAHVPARVRQRARGGGAARGVPRRAPG